MTFFALLGRLPARWRFAWSRGLHPQKLGRDTKSNGTERSFAGGRKVPGTVFEGAIQWTI